MQHEYFSLGVQHSVYEIDLFTLSQMPVNRRHQGRNDQKGLIFPSICIEQTATPNNQSQHSLGTTLQMWATFVFVSEF